MRPVRMADNLTTFMCGLSWNLGASTSCNPLPFTLCIYCSILTPEVGNKRSKHVELLVFIIIFSGSAAQCGLWPPVALQPSAGYGLLWLCSPAQAMASCGSAAQRGLWPPVALQPSAGYGLLVTRVSLITHNDAPQSIGLLWTSDQLVA
jgi:hypothetical protein